MDLSHCEVEVKDYGNIQLECLNFKLQKPKVVKPGRKWTTHWKWKAMQGSLKSYLVPKCCLVQTFVELNIRKTMFWELLGFPQNSKLIPLLQPINFLFLVHRRVHKHLKFFSEHLKLWIIVIVGLNFLQKFGSKTWVTNKEMFAKCQVMLLSHLFHCLFYQFLHLCKKSVTFLGNVLIV